jgi:hypothetical protein
MVVALDCVIVGIRDRHLHHAFLLQVQLCANREGGIRAGLMWVRELRA